jgi:hypothetical protein
MDLKTYGAVIIFDRTGLSLPDWEGIIRETVNTFTEEGTRKSLYISTSKDKEIWVEDGSVVEHLDRIGKLLASGVLAGIYITETYPDLPRREQEVRNYQFDYLRPLELAAHRNRQHYIMNFFHLSRLRKSLEEYDQGKKYSLIQIFIDEKTTPDPSGKIERLIRSLIRSSKAVWAGYDLMNKFAKPVDLERVILNSVVMMGSDDDIKTKLAKIMEQELLLTATINNNLEGDIIPKIFSGQLPFTETTRIFYSKSLEMEYSKPALPENLHVESI